MIINFYNFKRIKEIKNIYGHFEKDFRFNRGII